MNIQEWVEANVAPNVVSVGNIEQVGGVENGVKTYDVGVFVIIDANDVVNRVTQPVFEFPDGTFTFARGIVKDYEPPVYTPSPEKLLVDYLDAAVGPDNYIIHTPIETTRGKAAVATIAGVKKVIVKEAGEYLVRNFSE